MGPQAGRGGDAGTNPGMDRSEAPRMTSWEVAWTVQPGYEHFLNMHYLHEVGTETW